MKEIEEIEGSRVVLTFTILRKGWEMDNDGWVTEDGGVWTTSHGGLLRLDAGSLEWHIRETRESLDGLIVARFLGGRLSDEGS